MSDFINPATTIHNYIATPIMDATQQRLVNLEGTMAHVVALLTEMKVKMDQPPAPAVVPSPVPRAARDYDNESQGSRNSSRNSSMSDVSGVTVALDTKHYCNVEEVVKAMKKHEDPIVRAAALRAKNVKNCRTIHGNRNYFREEHRYVNHFLTDHKLKMRGFYVEPPEDIEVDKGIPAGEDDGYIGF